MAEEIVTLRNYSFEELEEILKKLSMSSDNKVHIELDGSIYEIPEPVNQLINSLYRMYEKEKALKKQKGGSMESRKIKGVTHKVYKSKDEFTQDENKLISSFLFKKQVKKNSQKFVNIIKCETYKILL